MAPRPADIPEGVLDTLLAGGHLTPGERAAAGVPEGAALRYRDVLSHLAAVIKRVGYFPSPFQEHVEGEPVNEHVFVEHAGPFAFVCHARRHAPLDPTVLAEEVHRRFPTARGAARFFLRWELGLPGTLDGWLPVR